MRRATWVGVLVWLAMLGTGWTAEAPWVLAPAAAIFIFVLAVNLTVQSTGRAPVQLEP